MYVEDTGSVKFPCIRAKSYSSVIINRKNATMIFDGKEADMDWNDEYYYGFRKGRTWEVKLNRTTLWLSKKSPSFGKKPNGYSCKTVSGI